MALAGETQAHECAMCPHACKLKPGQLGLCNARIGTSNAVVDQNYGRITSLALDPIEKKPLARFMPGKMVLSVGSYGCNMHCAFCQNSSIACAGENDVPWREMSPQQLVKTAAELRHQGNIGIAYTYNEPFVGFEFVRDSAKLVRNMGMNNVVVTNGMINPSPLSEIIPFLDAANVDLKAFKPEVYRALGGNLNCVKQTIATMAAAPTCHLEVTTLVVPGMNDSEKEIAEATKWLASLDEEIPYHLSRFFSCHKMAHYAPISVSRVYELADVARNYLKYVYTGNC